jgi:hypothetical protein
MLIVRYATDSLPLFQMTKKLTFYDLLPPRPPPPPTPPPPPPPDYWNRYDVIGLLGTIRITNLDDRLHGHLRLGYPDNE